MLHMQTLYLLHPLICINPLFLQSQQLRHVIFVQNGMISGDEVLFQGKAYQVAVTDQFGSDFEIV